MRVALDPHLVCLWVRFDFYDHIASIEFWVVTERFFQIHPNQLMWEVTSETGVAVKVFGDLF